MDVKGPLNVQDSAGKVRLELEAVANGGRVRVRDSANKEVAALSAALNVSVLQLGGSGFDGTVILLDTAGKRTVLISGRDGDITLSGADAAENFEFEGPCPVAGTVMVIDPGGLLRESTRPYDPRVAGVVSDAGSYRPGVVLGSNVGDPSRTARIALAGRVLCRADASSLPIGVGDLLTSSSVPGHAMRAADRDAAFGAVLGKALQPLDSGTALIPILVALQ